MKKDIQGTFSAEIIDIALPENWGVVKKDGAVCFIPDGTGVVGDKVKINPLKKQKNYFFGEIIETEEDSPFKIAPKCPHFEKCGGCVLQNLQYDKQLEIKLKYLKKTLKSIGNVPENLLDDLSITPSKDLFGYRNKMEYSIGMFDEKVEVGLKERVSPIKQYSNQITPIKECAIFGDIASTIFETFKKFASDNMGVEYKKLVLKRGKNTGEIMVIIVTKNGDILKIDDLAEQMSDAIPELKSFYWVEETIDRHFGDIKKIFGQEYIEETIGDIKCRIYPQTFFQTNTYVANLIYNKITEFAGEAKQVLGLYCGSGAMEMFLSKTAKNVVGIDSDLMNIKNAVKNCEINSIENYSFYRRRVEKIKNLSFEADLLLINPPRTGLTKKAMEQVLALNVPRIIYLSCSPATLSRDIKKLQSASYTPKKIDAFDMFPHTSHVETVVLLEK